MKEKIASLVAEGIDEALRELMPILDGRFSKADERMLERVNLASEKIRSIEKGLPDPESIREAVYSALKSQLSALDLSVDTIKARVEVLRELRDGDAGRDGLDGRDGKDGKDGSIGKDGLDGRDGTLGKDGRDGKDGLDGRDGRDGAFPAAASWEKDKEYPHRTVATHRSGVWYAERATDSEPGEEASGWIMLANGLHDVNAVWDHEKDIREFKLYIEMASGETLTHGMRVPFTQYREVWVDGDEYEPQDMVTMGGSLWMCLRDTDSKPGTDAGVGFWKLAVKRGADGKDGRRGEMGPIGLTGDKGIDGKSGKPGVDGTDGSDGSDGEDGKRGPRGAAGKDGDTGLKGIDGRQGDHFVDVDIDMELRNLNLIRDDETYISIPLDKLGKGVEKAFQWQGTLELGSTYRPGDVVSLSPTQLIICLNTTSSIPTARADSVRNHPDWDVFIWVKNSSGGGGKSIEIEDMWVLTEGIDLPADQGQSVSEAVNNIPTPLTIPENQVTVFGWANGKYLYTANQRDHSVGIGGNYVTTDADFYLLTQTGLTEVFQWRVGVDDNGGATFVENFNLQDFSDIPGGALGNGLFLQPGDVFYIIDTTTEDTYIWSGPKSVYVGLNGNHVADDSDLKLISEGNKDLTSGIEAPIAQPGHGFTLGQCVRWDGVAYVLAIADDPNTTALGVVTDVADADNFKYASIGRYDIGAHGWTAEEWYFLSDTIPGGLTRTEPEISQPIIYVEDTNFISIFPYRPSAEQIQSVGEAPEDGVPYSRQDGTWIPASAGGGGVPEAPEDGTPYSRQDATWIPADEMYFSEDQVFVIGTDFANVEEAIQWCITHRPIGHVEQSVGVLRPPKVTIEFPAGNYAPIRTGVAAGSWVLSDVGYVLVFKEVDGTASADITVGEDGSSFYISNCKQITFSGITLAGFVYVTRGSDCYIGIPKGGVLTAQVGLENCFLNVSLSSSVSVLSSGITPYRIYGYRVIDGSSLTLSSINKGDIILGGGLSSVEGRSSVYVWWSRFIYEFGVDHEPFSPIYVTNDSLMSAVEGFLLDYSSLVGPVPSSNILLFDDGARMLVSGGFSFIGPANGDAAAEYALSIPSPGAGCSAHIEGVIDLQNVAGFCQQAPGIVNAEGFYWSDGATTPIGEAPADGTPYARQDAAWIPIVAALNDLNDTSIDANPELNQLLQYNGTDWVNVSAGKIVLDGLRELLADDPALVSQIIKDIL